MNAIIPHKDTLFFLANLQRKILELTKNKSELLPLYPLFAFLNHEPDGTITEFTIELPATSGNFICLPVIIATEKEKITAEIKIARTMLSKNPELPELPEEIKNAFPKRERIFRTASVVIENNGWQVFDDKWHKLK